MSTGKFIFGIFCGLLVFVALYFGLGYLGVIGTKTIGKAQQNADREVFEQTQSYVQGKRQELVKLHHEWMSADNDSKKDIEATVRISFANFDENKYLEDSPELYSFLKKVKYQ